MKARLLVLTALSVLVAPFALAQYELPSDAADLPIQHLLSIATSALSAGKSQSALNIFEHILERDPTDFATLYKRATVRLATGQWAKAKQGFEEVLKVRDFDQAHLELARLHAKLGEYAEALKELEVFLAMTTKAESKQEAKVLMDSVKHARAAKSVAESALANNPPHLQQCLESSTAAINLSPNDVSLRLLRAECYLLSSSYDSAVGDLSRASTMTAALPPHLLLRLSLVSAFFLETDSQSISPDALGSIKRCLNADPDSKPCRKAFKALKALDKDLTKLRNWTESGKWLEAAVVLAGSSSSSGVLAVIEEMIKSYQQPLPTSANAPAPLPATENLSHQSPLLTSLHSTLCRAYITLNNPRKVNVACEEVLKRNPEDMWGLVGKADKMMAAEEWEESVRVLSDAFEKTGRSDRMILEKLQKAQRLLKQSKAKDYYKVLGVTRDADARTIKRAYRKGTIKNHPDKAGGSEAKMAALNEAYEVLSDPELRARFDNGEDPNDPQAGQQHQGHPFGGGNPFGGGGFHGGFPFGGGGGGGQQFFQQSGGFKFKFG